MSRTSLVNESAYTALMDEFDARLSAHMEATGDNWDMAAEFRRRIG